MMDHGPWALSSDEGCGEEECVERDVIFSHELNQFDIIRLVPPVMVVFSKKLFGNTDITDRRVKPHVEYFVFPTG